MTPRKTLRSSVQAALRVDKPQPCDKPLADLATHYAGLIDDAAPAAKYARALEWLDSIPNQEDAEQHVRTIRAALSEHSATSDIGPKLLATLEALQMSPRARALARLRGGKGHDQPAVKSRLDELRLRRSRKNGAPPLDTATS